MECIYCGKEIINQKRNAADKDFTQVYLSSEHVIHNALGGLLESTEICCDVCNTLLSQQDMRFSNNFASFVSLIDNLHQTRPTKSLPKHKGWGYNNGKWYDIVLAGNKPVACPEYQKEHKTSEIPEFENIKHDISLDNESFGSGMQKIAVNFARYSNIQPKILRNNYEIYRNANGEVSEIKFKRKNFPFIPLNCFDKYIEQTEINNLYHMLILFNIDNYLYCYVDLFNTWQCYNILSDEYFGDDVYKSYVQLVQSWNRPEYDVQDINSLKDLSIFKLQYGYDKDVSGTIEEQIQKITKIATIKNQNEPYQRELDDFILDRIGFDYVDYVKDYWEKNSPFEFSHNFYVYLDQYEREKLKDFTFRRLNPVEGSQVINEYCYYPDLILSKINDKKQDFKAKISEYCNGKITRLNDYLTATSG